MEIKTLSPEPVGQVAAQEHRAAQRFAVGIRRIPPRVARIESGSPDHARSYRFITPKIAFHLYDVGTNAVLLGVGKGEQVEFSKISLVRIHDVVAALPSVMKAYPPLGFVLEHVRVQIVLIPLSPPVFEGRSYIELG